MIKEKAKLIQLMREGAIVIAPNNRLSSELLNDFGKDQIQLVQDKPYCLPYSAFLQERYKNCVHNSAQTMHPLILNNEQHNYLWRKVLTNEGREQINEGLLEAVKEAWTRCHLWQLDLDHPAFTLTPQTCQFQHWAAQFQNELTQLNALTEVQLVDYLLTQPKRNRSEILIWACFDDYTPQQRALQNYFQEQGCENHHYDLTAIDSRVFQFEAKEDNDEKQQLVLWLRERLAQGEQRIAVVVPDLQTQSKSLQRLLQKELPLGTFNISLGQHLQDYALVAHALCWLELNDQQLDREKARLLLHSPYLAFSQTEMLVRAQLMEDSVALKEPQVDAAAFYKELNRYCPKLAELLKKLAAYPDKASPQQWINTFKDRLMTLGFPGEYSLSSASYQCYQRLMGLFDDFKQLTLINGSMSKSEALTTLNNMAKSTIFQPKKAPASIHVLGLLEASGCTFDSLWMMGLTDQALPQKARLSAFIPIALQRDNLMPHASPARELQLAEKTLSRLANSSREIVFSFPRLSADKPNLASPLIVHLPQFSSNFLAKTPRESLLVDWIEDYKIPLTPEERITGGTTILANQAKCPFRAFAAHRLQAKAGLEVSDGPDARERGQLIHKVMELLWLSLQSQKNLLSLSKEQLDQQIETAIYSALEPLISQRPHSFSTLIQEVELSRLKRLVHACLDWERQRPAFEVEAIEQAYNINLAGIDFRLRVDRLDRLANGKKWVIDYKSSLPQSQPWKEERPKEPQLLLYALLDETINTLLFAQLKAGQLSCKGLSEENHDLNGLNTIKKDETWAEYRDYWQSELQALAEEFSQGHCQPQPASASICQQCDFQNLCRFAMNS